jgi:hypothetical protein
VQVDIGGKGEQENTASVVVVVPGSLVRPLRAERNSLEKLNEQPPSMDVGGLDPLIYAKEALGKPPSLAQEAGPIADGSKPGPKVGPPDPPNWGPKV